MTFDDDLADCLNDIDAGRKTVAECITLFPELATELRAALALRYLRSLTLRPEADRLVNARLRQALASRSRRPQTLLRWAVAGLIALLVLFSVSTLASASAAVPGDVLYGIKRVAEAMQLSITPASDRAALLTTLAQRRLEELSVIVGRGQASPSTLASLIRELAMTTEAAIAAVEQVPAASQSTVIQAIIQETLHQQAVLQEIRAVTPPEAQAEIQKGLLAAANIQNQALDRLGGVDPGAQATPVPTLLPTATETRPTDTATPVTNAKLPPGQAKTTTADPPSSRLPESPGPTLSSVVLARTPPGPAQQTKHAPAAPTNGLPTSASPNAGGGQCRGNNPNCVTPSPDTRIITPVSTITPASGEVASPTACPTNPGGHPKCRP